MIKRREEKQRERMIERVAKGRPQEGGKEMMRKKGREDEKTE